MPEKRFVPKPEKKPSLARLALLYGTITRDQYKQVSTLMGGPGDGSRKEAEILLRTGLATRYQISLLKLIREYQIIREKGEAFGRLAVEKGFATQADIQKALDLQKQKFRESRLRKLLGDILVEAKIITPEQKRVILREQRLVEEKILALSPKEDRQKDASEPDPVELSQYEKEFLKVKALDEDFSAAILEKGFAGEDDIRHARHLQDDAFEQQNTITLLGDIMVDLKMISRDQKEVIFREQGRGSDPETAPRIHVEILEDKMAAWVCLSGDRTAVTLDMIKEAITAAGITQGIYPDPILQGGLSSGGDILPVARQDHSTALRNARGLVCHLDTGLSEKGEKRKGDVLAEHSKENAPIPCKSILGTVSPSPSYLDFTIRCGTGSRTSKDGTKILAAKSGQPVLSVERLLYVHPAIHVLEDVDQRYGPVEAYANLTVAGTITGAHPITAGAVRAREIRGGQIDAIGSVRVDVGITDAVIRAQGDVHARYLHNCRIETFGSLYVENEIFDSDIRCSGKIDSPNCRVVASRLFAKQGVLLAGTGSEKTQACEVTAGSEHHLFAQVSRLMREIEKVKTGLDRLTEKKEEKLKAARRTFEKMVELKVFHDRAKKTKEMMIREVKNKGAEVSANKKKQFISLVANYDARMNKALESLKDLNRQKKKYEKSGRILEEKVERLIPRVQNQVKDLERTLFAYLEWARFQPENPRIELKGKAYPGSVFGGVHSTLTLESDREEFILEEQGSASGTHDLRFL